MATSRESRNNVEDDDGGVSPGDENDPCMPRVESSASSSFSGGGVGGMEEGTGILHVVSGTLDYAEKAFLPVVEYLRDTLGIQDARERRRRERK